MTPPDRPALTPRPPYTGPDEAFAKWHNDRPALPAPDLDADESLFFKLHFQAKAAHFFNGGRESQTARRAFAMFEKSYKETRQLVSTLRAQLAERDKRIAELTTVQDALKAVESLRDAAIRVGKVWEQSSHEQRSRAEAAEARVAALEAALKDADGWLPIALCPTDGVWRLVKLSDGNEAVAAFDGVGLLSKKRWQTKVFLTHRPACPSPINDLVTQPARDVFLIADLENGVYPTHFRPNDTVFGLPALKGAAT